MPSKLEIKTFIHGPDCPPDKKKNFLLIREGLKAQGIDQYEATQIAWEMEFGGHIDEQSAVLAAYQNLSANSRDKNMQRWMDQSAEKIAKARVTGMRGAPRKEARERAVDAARIAAKAHSEMGTPIKRKNAGKTEPKLTDFMAEDAPTVVIVTWVARNLSVDDPDPATCPCPAAWNLLKHAKLNSEDFWNKLWYAMIPPRSQMDDDAEGGKQADMPVRELIDRLLAEEAVAT